MAIHQIYIIAGEPSGDQLGSRLISSIREKMVGNIEFLGIGGPEMEAQGLQSIFPMSELSVMGLLEVLPRLPNILRRIKYTVNHILKTQPDVVVTIDSPDFSFRIVKQLQGKGIPLIHYVAPSVWAWKPSRAKKLANKLDHLLTLLPFEAPFFEDKGLSSSFVGHPVIESGYSQVSGSKFRSDYNIPANEPVLCLLPGSRINEVNKILPIIRDTIDRLDILDLHTVLPIVETVKSKVYEKIQDWRKIPIIVDKNEKYAAFAASNCGIAASGTVSLELAIAKVPYVTVYKVNWLSGLIAKRYITTPYVNLVNILLKQEVVPELLQERCTSSNIAKYVAKFLNDASLANKQIDKFDEAVSNLKNGQYIPSDMAAEIIIDFVDKEGRGNGNYEKK